MRWHRQGFRLFWKGKSRPRGRPRLPSKVQKLIVDMAVSNPTWGEERIAAELLLKLGLRLSARTVRRYMPKGPTHQPDPKQRWMTFVRNHAKATIASDFFVVVTATFQLVYVFVIIEVAARRVLHFNVTRHPSAEWTLQQFRECIAGDEEEYRYVIHDRDRIYSGELDGALKSLGLTVLRTPYKSPQANAVCERFIGTARRECLDYMIPLNEAHLRQILKSWVAHYNRGRPHSSLGPGIPEPVGPNVEQQSQRHRIPDDHRITKTPILGGLHHEYRLEKVAA
jgi:transposase InsO family protein